MPPGRNGARSRGPGGAELLFGPDGRPLTRDTSGRLYQPDGFALPHVLTFTSIISGADHTLFHERFDEAMRSSRQDALIMENDCFLMGLLQERKLAVASLKWHLDVPDAKDPRQDHVAKALTRLIEQTPYFYSLRYSLLDAIWYGRQGVQVQWDWTGHEGRRALCVRDWRPVVGDKIGHQQDGTPYILGHSAEIQDLPGAEVITTTRGMAVRINRNWRDRFLFHRHEVKDADFFAAERAEAVHGLGVRSVVHWLNFLKLEHLSRVVDYMDRVGLGITLWYYDASNPEAKDKALEAAREQSDRTNLIVPRWPDSKQPAVERVEVPTAGVEVLNALVEVIDGYIERYVVGQSMSGGADDEDGLGGTGRAEFARNTKDQIRNWDAANFDDSMTGTADQPSLAWMLQAHTFPETLPGPLNPQGFRCRYVSQVDKPNPEKQLQAAKTVVDMGASVKADEVRAMAGLSKPEQGDEVLSLAEMQKQQQAAQQPPGMGMPGMSGPPGPPGGAPPGGAPPGPPKPPEGRPPSERPWDPDAGGGAPKAKPNWYKTTGPRGGHLWHSPAGKVYRGPGQSPESRAFLDSLAQMRREGEALLYVGPWDEAAHPRETTAHDGKQPGEFAPGTRDGEAATSRAAVKHSGTEAARKKSARKVFGPKADLDRVPWSSLVGAPDGAEVLVTPEKDGSFRLDVTGPGYEATRYLKRLGSGELVVENSFIKVTATGAGTGSEIFARQVEACAAFGVGSIRCHAARSGSNGPNTFNGYYTWPRLGYDQDLEVLEMQRERALVAELRRRFPGASSLLDVMASKEGRDFWRERGVDLLDARFDLTEGSRSRRILATYLKERVAKPAAIPAAQYARDADDPREEIDLNAEEEAALERAWARLEAEGARGGREGEALLYVGPWDEAAHPRETTAHDGKQPGEFAPGGQGGVATKDKDTPAKPPWDGRIVQGDVSEAHGSSEHVATWSFYDENGDHYPQNVYVVEGTYDPDPDDPRSELQSVYRWFSAQEGDGDIQGWGEWVLDRDEAVAAGEKYAEDNDQEPPRESEEDDEEEDEEDDWEETARQAAHKAFDPLDWEEALDLVGLVDSGEINVTVGNVVRWLPTYSDDPKHRAWGVRVSVKGPQLKSMKRFFGVDDKGNRFIMNELLEVKSEYAKSGLGSQIFSAQCERAAAAGYAYITCHAAGDKDSRMNGYYTWPRFGYDESLDSVQSYNPKLAAAVQDAFPDAQSILDIMGTAAGRDWWKENGDNLRYAKFDLSEGSRSWRVLRAYLSERASREAPAQHQRGAGAMPYQRTGQGKRTAGEEIDLNAEEEAALERAWTWLETEGAPGGREGDEGGPAGYAVEDWQPHTVLSGPNKGQSAWKHRVSGKVIHHAPTERDAAGDAGPAAAKQGAGAAPAPATGQQGGAQPGGAGAAARQKPDPEAARQEYQQQGTRAQAFKAWFGDWEADPENASQVVDPETGEPAQTHSLPEHTSQVGKDGVPVAVFHGTPGQAFGEFDRSKLRNPEALVYGPGFYFSEDRRFAEDYTKDRAGAPTGAVLTVYLNIRTPFRAGNVYTPEEYQRITGEKPGLLSRLLGGGKKEYSGDDVYGALVKRHGGRAGAEQRLRQLGYDGIHTPVLNGQQAPCWVAFEPGQIKAVDNAGTFDPADSRIAYSEAQADFLASLASLDDPDLLLYGSDDWTGPHEGKQGGQFWINIHTQRKVYSHENPGGRGDAHRKKLEEARKEKVSAQKGLSREQEGHAYGEHLAETSRAIDDVLAQPSPDKVQALGQVLAGLKVRDLVELKKKHGLRASGTKPELARKIAERAFQAGARAAATAPASPAAPAAGGTPEPAGTPGGGPGGDGAGAPEPAAPAPDANDAGRGGAGPAGVSGEAGQAPAAAAQGAGTRGPAAGVVPDVPGGERGRNP